MKSIKFFTVVLAFAGLSACGGGDGGSAAPTSGGGTTTPTMATGVLTDDPMVGVPYSTPSNPNGVTGADGSFQFQTGEMVTFNVAGVEISVEAANRITPAVIAESLFPNDEASRTNAVANIAVLFQTVDADGDPNNGVITLRENAAIEGVSTENLITVCAQAPADFQQDLQTANAGNNTIRDDNTPPTVANPDDALERFYRNELAGTWLLARFEPTSGPVEPASLDSFTSVLSFDRGCTSDCTTPSDGRTLINRFVGGDYDSVGNVSADARIGRVVYVRSDSPVTSDPNIGKFLVRNPNDNRLLRANATGSAAGSTDPNEDIYNRPLLLNGDELVVQFADGNLVYTRFGNQKNTLVGTWIEDLSGETTGATGAPNPTNGRHSFLRATRTIAYHFLSSSRLMIIVTDLDASANNGDEQNGVVYANYTFSGSSLQLGTILANTTAATAGGGIVVEGESLNVSGSDLNDTRRILSETDASISIYRLLSLTESLDESSAGFKQAETATAAP